MEFEKSCGCIVFDKDKVLLVKHNEGHWDFPKGHMEENETEVQTAIREVKEETNIDVEVNSKHRYTINYKPKENVFKEVVFWVAKKKSEEIIPQDSEIQKVEWVNIEKAIDLITYDNSREMFKRVLQEVKQ